MRISIYQNNNKEGALLHNVNTLIRSIIIKVHPKQYFSNIISHICTSLGQHEEKISTVFFSFMKPKPDLE